MKRKEQYLRKLEFIIDKITILPENVEKNIFYIDALFYRLQVSVDAAMDVVAMVCKDKGITVKDDYSNIQELEKHKIIDSDLLNELRRLNGLRNALVHRYNKIEEESIIKEKTHFVKILKKFTKIIQKIIEEQFNEDS